MPPSSKFGREVTRLRLQTQDLFARTGLPFLLGIGAGQAQKRALRAQSRSHPGALPMGRHAAVYLIFPDRGVLASHLAALDYMTACGYAPVVVSNLPLSAPDLGALRERSALVSERPNFGYDFGGYEHAIHLLQADLPRLERLAIFNDSAWFPMHPGTDWFAAAEALNRDVVGAYARSAMKAPRDTDPGRLTWTWDPSYHRFHYSSFALLLGAKVLRSQTFARFWARYIPTDDKNGTVARGEVGLTRALVSAGFSHGATWPTERLPDLIAALDEAELRVLTGAMIHENRRLYTQLTRGLAEADPERLRQILLAVVARQGPSYTWAPYDLAHRQGQFVKKAPMRWSATSAAATLAMLERQPAFHAEAMAMGANPAAPIGGKAG